MSANPIPASRSEVKEAVQDTLVRQPLRWQRDAFGEFSVLTISLAEEPVAVKLRRSDQYSLLSGKILAELGPDELSNPFDRWPPPNV